MNDYDQGWGHGYTTALDETNIAINQILADRHSRLADHPGLHTALTVLEKLRRQPHTWDNENEDAL